MRGKGARGTRAGNTLVLIAALAAVPTACRDSGLPDRNLPKAQAEQRTYAYPAYQAAAETPEIWELGGRRWQAAGAVETIQPTLLRSIASAGGSEIYALNWDTEPYDRLYTPAGSGQWRVLQVID